MTSLISSLSWIPRGAAAQHPTKYTVDASELERIQGLARGQLDAAKMELELARMMEADAEGRGEEGEEEGEGEWEDDEESAAENGDALMDVEEDAAMQEHEDDADAATAAAAKAAKRIKAAAKNGDAAKGDAKKADDDDELAAYNLDTYDEESSSTAMGAFSNIKGLTYYGDNAEDPYITLESKNEDEELEREELEIYPTDNLIVAAKTEDDVSQLEVYVYDDREENLYVHHDLLLPAMPLCLEWLDFCPGRTGDDDKKGNFVAVGTLDPEIEIWSLDVVDGLYPDAILGPPPKDPNAPEPAAPSITDSTPATDASGKKKKKKKPKKPKKVANPEYHVDSILSLSWNRSHRNLLASSSADKTIKLWDLARPTSSPALRSFDSLHADKVQSVMWNPKEPTVLLSGAWDGTVRVFDSRAPDAGVGTKVDSDVECLRWDPWEPASFLVSMENGCVQAFDSRMLAVAKEPSSVQRGKSLWTLAAHDSSVSSLDINPLVKGCIVTGGTDNMVKVWNVDEQAGGKRNISLVTARDLGVGKVFSASFCPDDPTTLAVAGSKANLQIWDTATNPGVRSVFGDRLRALGKDLSKTGAGVVGLADDDESDVSDDEE
ncbi:rRNA-processing protein [Rhodotorula toruloides]